MTAEATLDEIRDANLTYLMLAQALIRKDRAQALYRLGLTEEVAELIAGLSAAQILKISQNSMLMCRFRFDDEAVWSLLTSHGRRRDGESGGGASGMHAAILMSGRMADHAAPLARAA